MNCRIQAHALSIAAAIEDSMFRKLTSKEEKEFKQWARDNWSVDQKVNPVWHPVVIDECASMLDDHIRDHTQKYDMGTLDWNFSYKDQTVALDSTSGEISEEEQYEMAVEHFWETKWEELTNGEN
jgi:hypothetical protein